MILTVPLLVAKSFLIVVGVVLIVRVVLHVILGQRFKVHARGAILITGASTGIGRHAAEYMASKGFTVFAGVRKEKDAAHIASSKVPNLRSLLIDVNSHESVTKAVSILKKEIEEANIHLVAVVNNAGVGESFPGEFHSLENARSMFETNFWGAIDLTQQTLPLLRDSKGRVVMISSVAALVSQPMVGMYCASKKALEGFTDSLRQEVETFGVSVSIVEPAYVNTSLLGKAQTLQPVESLSKEELNRKDLIESVYAPFYKKSYREKKLKTMMAGDSPQVTSDAICDAITAACPKTRYVVARVNGTPAWVVGWLFWAAPDRLKDFFIKNM